MSGFTFNVNFWGWVLIWSCATSGFLLGWALCFRMRAGREAAENALLDELGVDTIDTTVVTTRALRAHLLACLADAGTGSSHWGQSPEFRHLATMAGVPLPEAPAETQRRRVQVCGVDCHRGDDRCNGYCIGRSPRPAPQSAGTEDTPNSDDYPQPLAQR